MHILSVIPARIGSSRIPEKPLQLISGEPLIRLVARRVLEFDLGGPVVVASDDTRVLEAAAMPGVEGVLTSPSHRTGTERVAEVLRRPEYSRAQVALNVQVDEPFLPRAAAVGALDQVRKGFSIGTAAAHLAPEALRDRSVVKVVVDSVGRARKFARSLPSLGTLNEGLDVFHHLGVYAYTRAAILQWVSQIECEEERLEGLEQLRPLTSGFPIGVALVRLTAPPAVNTRAELELAQSHGAKTRVNR